MVATRTAAPEGAADRRLAAARADLLRLSGELDAARTAAEAAELAVSDDAVLTAKQLLLSGLQRRLAERRREQAAELAQARATAALLVAQARTDAASIVAVASDETVEALVRGLASAAPTAAPAGGLPSHTALAELLPAPPPSSAPLSSIPPPAGSGSVATAVATPVDAGLPLLPPMPASPVPERRRATALSPDVLLPLLAAALLLVVLVAWVG